MMDASGWTIQDARPGWVEVSLRREFRTNIKRLTTHKNVTFQVRVGDVRGLGEAYSMEAQEAYTALEEISVSGEDAWTLDSILEPVTNLAARSALDLALHDVLARRLDIAVHSLLGLPAARPETSVSIGVAEKDRVLQEARQWIDDGYNFIKMKMSTDTDPSLPVMLRKAIGPGARIRVDGNQAWDLNLFRDVAKQLKKADVEFCEQPFPVGQSELCAEAAEEGIPIFLDEEITGPADVARVWRHGGVNGVNVKLSKCGGLRRSHETIRLARSLGLRVMIGCYFTTSLDIAAAVHLCSLADAVDLDAPLFLKDDPMTGLRYEKGGPRVEGPGIGVEPKSDLSL